MKVREFVLPGVYFHLLGDYVGCWLTRLPEPFDLGKKPETIPTILLGFY